MFARNVPIVLIAAIIACPMWCGNGLCGESQCGAARRPASPPCPVHGANRCCCRDKGASNSRDDAPCDAPCESSCQGVCGGAVFERPIELNEAMEASFVYFPSETTAACQWGQCRTRSGEEHWQCGVNDGRGMRTLYMSLLC